MLRSYCSADKRTKCFDPFYSYRGYIDLGCLIIVIHCASKSDIHCLLYLVFVRSVLLVS
jgi:hypothetical protein